MHAVAFGAKRVFHSFLRVTRKPLRQWPGLTGARFDMLSAFLDGEWVRPVTMEIRPQRALRGRLGVCASVVSRMLKSLLKLGWVTRRRDPRDRRIWILSLTPKGEQVIREARRRLLRTTERLVDDALCKGARRRSYRRFERLFRITESLGLLRYHFSDAASLIYTWWPVPIDP